MIRVSFIFLFLVTLTVGTAWITFPFIAPPITTWQLQDYGWSVDHIAFKRPSTSMIHVVHLAATDVAGGYTLDAGNIVLKTDLTYIDSLSVEIEHMKIILLPSQSTEQIDLPEILNSYLSVFPLLVPKGKVQALEFCQSPEECLSGELEWSQEEATLEVRLTGQHFSLQLDLARQHANIGLRTSGGLPLAADLHLNWPDQSILNISGQIKAPGNAWSGYLPLELPEPLLLETDSLTVQLDLSLPITGYESSRVIANSAMGNIDFSHTGAWNWNAESFNLHSDIPFLASINIQSGQLQTNLSQPYMLEAAMVDTVAAVITVPEGLGCSISMSSLLVVCNLSKLAISTTLTDYQYVTHSLISTGQLEMIPGESTRLHAELDFTLTETNHPLVAALIQLTLDEQQLALLSNNMRIDQLDIQRLEIQHNLESVTGLLNFESSNDAGDFEHWTEIPATGQIQISQKLAWQGPFDIPPAQWQLDTLTDIKVTGLNIEIDGIGFTGGNITAALSGWPLLKTTVPARMDWQLIDPGIPVTETQMHFDALIDPFAQDFRIHGIHAELNSLGGLITSEKFSFDYASSKGEFMANLQNLDLMQVLALEKEDFYSEGKLIGQLPVQFDNGKISISRGRVETIAPGGLIQYRPGDSVKDLAKTNSQMNMVLDTLMNFHYDSMISNVSYSSDDVLRIDTALKGRNPDFEDGRQINFNLSIEEDVAALLESLRLGENFSRRLDNSLIENEN
jgi:hypothetical protein